MVSPRLSALARASRSRRGMSLVEIMVVIAIIGILTTVVAVNVKQRLDMANVETTKLQIKKVEEALDFYALKHGGHGYPSTSEGLAGAKKFFTNSEVPKDAWQQDFQYFAPGTHGDHPYELISLGADGKEGGEDANADIYSWDLNGTGGGGN